MIQFHPATCRERTATGSHSCPNHGSFLVDLNPSILEADRSSMIGSIAPNPSSTLAEFPMVVSEFWDFICEHSVCQLSGDLDDQVSHGDLGFHMVMSRVYKSSQPYYVSLRVCSGPQQTRRFPLCERPAENSNRWSC
jgi:hypothetical protein